MTIIFLQLVRKKVNIKVDEIIILSLVETRMDNK